MDLDQREVEQLLIQLEEKNIVHPRYHFLQENNELVLLGSGAFSYVYEMYDIENPNKRYAAKIMGLSSKRIDPISVIETSEIQRRLEEQTDHIVRTIAIWSLQIELQNGKILSANKVDNVTDVTSGLCIQIILMEKLDNIIYRDKYGKATLLKEELKTEQELFRFISQIGDAIYVMHKNGYLHRDIKLENILWDESKSKYKLSDFGIAKYIGENEAETIVFTDGYGAPEIEKQLADSYNATADIYSFGITLFLLLNDLKFPASDRYQASTAQYLKNFVMPAPEQASAEMAQIIRKMCRYDRHERFQSVKEVMQEVVQIDDNGEVPMEVSYDIGETETYHDEVQKNNKNSIVVKNWWEKEEDELTREDIKKKDQAYSEIYQESSVKHMLLITALSFFMLTALVPQVISETKEVHWILPLALVVLAIIQRVKQFQVEGSVLVIGGIGAVMYFGGSNIGQLIALGFVILGTPVITAGYGMGMLAWLLQVFVVKLDWLTFLHDWNLGWIFFSVLIAVIHHHMSVRWALDIDSDVKYSRWEQALRYMWKVFIFVGILLLLLNCFGGIIITKLVMNVPWIRMGIGVLFVIIGSNIIDNLEAKEEDVDECIFDERN